MRAWYCSTSLHSPPHPTHPFTHMAKRSQMTAGLRHELSSPRLNSVHTAHSCDVLYAAALPLLVPLEAVGAAAEGIPAACSSASRACLAAEGVHAATTRSTSDGSAVAAVE